LTVTRGIAQTVVDAARRLVRQITVLSASPGAVLCEAGAPAGEALLIVSGIVESSETGEMLTRHIVTGSGTPPVFPEDVRARTEVKFARLPVAAFDGESPDLTIDRLAPVILELLHRRDLVAGASALFGSLDADAIADLERESDWIDLKRGGVLMRQGDEGDRAFVLLAGRLQAAREAEDGTSFVVGDIAVGETVGEMALYTGAKRSATVRAVRDSLLIGLPRPTVERLLAARPEAMRHVITVQVARVQRANEGRRLRAPLTNIAIVPLDDADGDAGRVAAGAFCRQLSAALGAFGPVEHLDAARLDARLHRPGLADSAEDAPDAPRLLMWLDELERAARFVVYETSARHPGWLARSISRADAVILLGRGDGDPAVTEIERLVAREEGDHGAAYRMLVLLHDDEALPSRTAAWLAPRTIARHLHVRLSRPDEVGRVARFIAGRAVGLVLGAGGARGFAHVGVMRALREAGIPIDMVGGTSMGAAMSAQHAMGWSPERIVETADEVWNRLRPHLEYTWPVLSLLRGRRSRQCGEMMYGTTCIEDLWVPFFCVSSDLTDASMFVHRSGSLLDAVTASSSPPAVMVPTRVGDHLLCDGSLFNTLPVDLARELGCGTLVARASRCRRTRTSSSRRSRHSGRCCATS
jgi:CRP-like cAMP-binding protein